MRVRAAMAAAALSATAVVATPPAPAQTSAVAVNTRDGASVFRLAFHVARTARSEVEATNAAVAFATCEECQTVAASLQVVLVLSDPETLEATNLALAFNEGCTGCDTLAAAFQWVLTTGGPVVFSPDGNRALADLRRRLQALRTSDLDNDAVLAELRAISAELEAVLAGELRPVGSPTTTTTEDEDGTTTTVGESTTTTAPSTAATSTTAPAGSPTTSAP